MAPSVPFGDIFPTLLCCTKLVDNARLYDVKFYPYATTDDEQVFAVTGSSHVFVCRANLEGDPPFDVLRWFRNETKGDSFNSLAWTKDPITGSPQICVAGEKPKQIQILDVVSGQCVRTLAGHGNEINDLAISPLNPNLLASASADYTIRLWHLSPEYEVQPCVAIFAGEGHRQHVLACHFHPNGKWMLTAGGDTAVCLWAVPNEKELDDHRQQSSRPSHPNPKVVYYPHFHSTEVHSLYVDSVAFYGDLILSRCARDAGAKDKANEILLWRIDGFHSDDEPPAEPPIPTPGVWTRSSFHHDKSSRGFQRLLTFDMPSTSRFYSRFGLLHRKGMRPMLAMGNEASKYLFWDLQKLEEGWDPDEDKNKAKKPRGRKKMGANAVNATDPSSTSISAPPERKYDLSDPFVPLKAHHSVIAATALSARRHFGTMQVAWSPDGKWMVGVGDFGMMCVFHRDVVS
ncbi:hypothetical protein BAUCODRAFT_568121 [Baudoinia panamericana UAMH 10762]|uniref:Ig-like domain-containing protein n=1 Tax=Baudoinia panamericana (strain UAMH 10762) TaxID=717646 RepID=M2LGR3_BAUPA|nr:uncharacterized protein BAUCODRAFT_568121 [Baudoinia panamericana UAMH 10762]EMC93292.1 hypothetical protein BAUCODRAFT_568121 [Baudoinia panamericana UAMH 10762]